MTVYYSTLNHFKRSINFNRQEQEEFSFDIMVRNFFIKDLAYLQISSVYWQTQPRLTMPNKRILLEE